MELVFATHNPNKAKELKQLFPTHIKLLSLSDIGCNQDIPETSETIAGNALQKARYVKKHYGKDCFADDTGLEVEALDGAPGVRSARYAGQAKSDKANVDKLLGELKNKTNRHARFKTVIALIIEDQEYLFNGICNGLITEIEIGTEGFGYDPIFIPENQDKTFAQMSLSEKSISSHRGKAVQKLIDFLSK